MKPVRFAYHDPETLEEALDLLAVLGDEAKVLAGGQSLMPLLNLRLARPAHLIDITKIRRLRGIRQADGQISIGALTRHADVETSRSMANAAPLLAKAVAHVGHAAIRNRGTIGGSIAHADPSAELPAVMTALNASITLASRSGRRTVPAQDFFVMPLTTVAEPDELVESIDFREQPPRSGSAVEEVARRHGDFALVGVAASLQLDAAERIEAASIVTFGTGPRPVRMVGTQQLVIGRALDESLIGDVRGCASGEVQPAGDRHGSVQYRKTITGVLVGRALRIAWSAAMRRSEGSAVG